MSALAVSSGSWLLMVGVGALLALDGISWPQSMASRPVVAATIGGTLFGAPAAGFVAGAWLELVTLRHPPYGAARYPETGPAALLAGAAYGLTEHESLGALAASVLAGWAIGWIGMHTISLLRSRNARLLGDPDGPLGTLEDVERIHRRALRLDAARGAVITASLFVPVALAVRIVDVAPGSVAAGSATIAAAAVSLASLAGVGARLIGGRREGWPVFILGAVAGLALVWLAR